MINLNVSDEKDKIIDIPYLYRTWLIQQRNKKTGYFTMSNNIQEYLPLIKSPALNLYLFYAIHAKNELGYSYYSNERIARELQVSQKTISNWNKTLQDIGLITRKAQANSSSMTYLLPTSDFFIPNTNKNELAPLLKLIGTNEGYKIITPITLTIVTNVIKNYLYFPYYKIYTNKDGYSITRRITIEDTTSLENIDKDKLPLIESPVSWFDSDHGIFKTSLNIIWHPEKKENTAKDRQSIIEQLNTVNKINNFKKNYPEVAINL